MIKYIFSLFLLLSIFSCKEKKNNSELIDKMIAAKESFIQNEIKISDIRYSDLQVKSKTLKNFYKEIESGNKNYCDSIILNFQYVLDELSISQFKLIKESNKSNLSDLKLLYLTTLNQIDNWQNIPSGISSFIRLPKNIYKIGDTLKAEIGLNIVPFNSEYTSIVGADTLKKEKSLFPTYTETLKTVGTFNRKGVVLYYKNGEKLKYDIEFEFKVIR